MMSVAEAEAMNDRVNFVYTSSTANGAQEVELPFRVLVVGGFTPESEEFDTERPIPVTARNLDQVIRSLKIVLALSVADRLPGESNERLTVTIPITSMADFLPERVLMQVPELLDLNEVRELLEYLRDDGRDQSVIDSYLSPLTHRERIAEHLVENGINTTKPEEIDCHSLGYLLSEIETHIGDQLDEIIHHPEFARLESAWRGLQFLVERTNTHENCTTELLSVSKEALIADFEDVPEVTHSRLYDIVYGSEFGQFGGRPFGVLIGNYEFGPGSRDVKLAQQLAAIGNMAHAPFIAAVDSKMFDIESYAELSRLRDIGAIFHQEKFAKWNSFRQSEDARYFALTLPRFRLRTLYGNEPSTDGSFVYRESSDGATSAGAWGNSAFAFATRLVDSFSKYRWCINIAGDEEGKVEGLSMDNSGGAVNSQRIPAEVLIADRQERDLIAHGFIPLSIHKGSDTAAFFSSNSIIAGKQFSNDQKGREAALSHHMSSQLQYLFITCRIAHYLKMMQREHIGSWKNKMEVERELNDWLRQYISDMDNPAASIRARRPLRRARIVVNDLDNKHDWYVIEILLTPHLKYMGASFTLEETGRLDKH